MDREYKLRICGNECTILSDESEENVAAIAAEVEERINEIYNGNERVSLALAAILTAMSFCEEHKEAKDNTDNLRSQIKAYLDDASKACDEKDEALREIDGLRREIDALRVRLNSNK